jgi:hypothetical protein
MNEVFFEHEIDYVYEIASDQRALLDDTLLEKRYFDTGKFDWYLEMHSGCVSLLRNQPDVKTDRLKRVQIVDIF